ncbi:MAG: hypothetical protein ACRCRZ_00425 [Metamycoplasmataceae bacterium]
MSQKKKEDLLKNTNTLNISNKNEPKKIERNPQHTTTLIDFSITKKIELNKNSSREKNGKTIFKYKK